MFRGTKRMSASPRTLQRFGFKFGRSGAHSARSMMLDELRALICRRLGVEQVKEQITEYNVLNKPTQKSRDLTYRHMLDLYGLDTSIPLYRVLTLLWPIDRNAQPLLALYVALARDPLLLSTMPFIGHMEIGETVTRQDIEMILKAPDTDRFSPASLKSFAQNINGTWTQSGFLRGKAKKIRVRPSVFPENVVLAMFLAYLEGMTGERILQSPWCKFLGLSAEDLIRYAMAASHRSLIDFKHSGGVTEVTFPGFLTPEEEQWRHE